MSDRRASRVLLWRGSAESVVDLHPAGFLGILPIGGKAYLKRAVQCLVTLYEATDQADKATQWKSTLVDIERLKTDK